MIAVDRPIVGQIFFLSRGTARDRFLAITRGSLLREDQLEKYIDKRIPVAYERHYPLHTTRYALFADSTDSAILQAYS